MPHFLDGRLSPGYHTRISKYRQSRRDDGHSRFYRDAGDQAWLQSAYRAGSGEIAVRAFHISTTELRYLNGKLCARIGHESGCSWSAIVSTICEIFDCEEDDVDLL